MTDLERMLIEHACHKLCIDYAHFADTGQPVKMAGLFTEDGALRLPTGVTQGRANLAKGPTPPANLVMRHVMSNIRTEVESADAASGVAYITVYFALREGDGPAQVKVLAPRALGVYHDRYVRTAEGWRIADREFKPAIALAEPATA